MSNQLHELTTIIFRLRLLEPVVWGCVDISHSLHDCKEKNSRHPHYGL